MNRRAWFLTMLLASGCDPGVWNQLCWEVFSSERPLLSLSRGYPGLNQEPWESPILLDAPEKTHQLRIYALFDQAVADKTCGGEAIRPAGWEDVTDASSGIVYASSNDGVFAVSESGTITAVGPGTATLVVTYGQLTRTSQVDVAAGVP